MMLLRCGLLTVFSLVLAACQTFEVPADGEAPTTAMPTVQETPASFPSFDPSKYADIFVYTIEEIDNEGRSLLHVSYPVTEQDAINTRMEAVTEEFIAEYRTTAKAIEKAYQDYRKETGREAATFVTHYRQYFDVAIANENLVFFDIVRSVHTGGTGNAFVVGYIFDRRDGAELSISDLFVDGRYLERLSTLTREVLGERARGWIAEGEYESDAARKKALEAVLRWIEEGTAPTAENFDNILFRDNGTVLIAFDKYQVAAGVAGVVEVELPASAIDDLLKPEIRGLLGEEAGAAVPLQEVAQTLEQVWARVRLGSSVVAEALSPPAAQASSLVEEEIDCYEVPCVALTFDDGPSIFTGRLLDILKEHNVKATFFILGSNARIQSETVSRAFAEGHEIGNHTWDHPLLTEAGLSEEYIHQQIQWTDDIVTQIIGEPPVHLRPPYGAYNDRVLAIADIPFISWSIDPLDWRDRDAEIVAARIVDAPPGAIILAHDIHETTVDAVPAVIVALKERGINFVTVTKLFAPQELL
ncbi:MAG: polysaccharide deacetylase family protein, partial [Chloroflexi bacterium]|nr:polysaccharide deacetylase family protein [Chloroflexota bacterium]